MEDNKIEYSVVVPVYDEEGNIEKLYSETKDVLNSLSKTKSYEIIFVEDCSSDNSKDILKNIAKKDKNVKIIVLNKNYGQSTALDAGFKASKGNLVISMDGDGQNDPADIPKMLEKLKKENLDVVTGWRKNRKDKSGIKLLSRFGKFLRSVFLHDRVHDTGCTLRVHKKEAVKSLDLQGEMHRYILALLRWKGFKIGEIPVNHRKRENGKSKYGYQKMYKGFIDLVYVWFIQKFSQRPLHIFGLAGIVSAGIGVLIEIWMAYQKIFNKISLSDNAWFLLGFFAIITGILLFSFGIVLDLLIKVYHNTSPFERRYYVNEVVGN